MSIAEALAEGTARRLDRRRFLGRTAAAVFGFSTAAAVAGFRPPTALAIACTYRTSSCQCSPLGGNYCGTCSGSSCGDPCIPRLDSCPPGGVPNQCWCTDSCCYNPGGGSYIGHYECCDCDCPGADCTCRAFVIDCLSQPGPAEGIICC